MLILGINGGFDPVFESRYGFEGDYVHDSSAVLLRDGWIVAGIEEERLTRIKHCNKSFFHSIRHCLEVGGVTLDDIDRIALYVTEEFLDVSLKALRLHRPWTGPLQTTRSLISGLFEREFGKAPPAEKFVFVNHHVAHAMSAYAVSGFGDSLILAIDGAGENISTLVAEVRDGRFTMLKTKPVPESLGFFYLDVIPFLGYAIYDEYKVMGLAPYGDPARYRELFSSFYSLLPDGDYTIHKDRIFALYKVLTPRGQGEVFTQVHMDLAAALQEALESIVFHLLRHYRAATGLDCLAMAGGVAQNSSMNGKLLETGLFRDVFVPVYAADSGCSVGSALAVAREQDPAWTNRRLDHVYWGSDVGSDDRIEPALKAWQNFLTVRRLDDTADEVAGLMAEGSVVGWVQGKSEFGPRALGNRSILADPRRASHKETINAMIKKREAYRPFAPSVLEEHVEEYFEVPDIACKRFPFMAFVLKVREAWRERLGAIAHVDGTARLQTVSRETNPRYWELIRAFGKRTGVNMLLNTSFNNNAEPIVDSIDDAVVCYLTSGLDYLVVSDFLATKRPVTVEAFGRLVPVLPAAARLICDDHYVAYGKRQTSHYLAWNYDDRRRRQISAAAWDILRRADGRRTLADLAAEAGLEGGFTAALKDEFWEVWSDRRVILRPSG
jgi:carbamoyltransferase